MFDRLVASVSEDLGGADRLSTVQKGLVEAFAAASVVLNDLNVRALLGQQISLADHAAAISSLVRVAARIGMQRVPRDVTPDPLVYARTHGGA
jgi:hypothetical protein